jgi:hypothetical protein
MKYEYTPVPGPRTIRLLTLLAAGNPADPLHGRLSFWDLKDKPKYEAISYVWGDPAHCDEILIHGKSDGKESGGLDDTVRFLVTP